MNYQQSLFDTNVRAELDKVFKIHERETNSESEKYLNLNKKRIGNNLQKLLEAFMRGEIINSYNSPVGDFRRRKRDLTHENGFKISLYSTEGNLKNWYMTTEDIEFNKTKL